MPLIKILACDDEANIRESIKLILEKEPYSLFFAADGQETLDKVRSLKPDIVLLDIKMPKLPGIEAISEIKTLSPETKVIMVSGYGDTQVIKEALSRGASDYLKKSFSGQQLKDIIKSTLKAK